MMDIDSEEKVKLLDVKDGENINNHNEQQNGKEQTEEEFVMVKQRKSVTINSDIAGRVITASNGYVGNGDIAPSTERRSDEPAELSFEKGTFIGFYIRVFSFSSINESLVA